MPATGHKQTQRSHMEKHLISPQVSHGPGARSLPKASWKEPVARRPRPSQTKLKRKVHRHFKGFSWAHLQDLEAETRLVPVICCEWLGHVSKSSRENDGEINWKPGRASYNGWRLHVTPYAMGRRTVRRNCDSEAIGNCKAPHRNDLPANTILEFRDSGRWRQKTTIK